MNNLSDVTWTQFVDAITFIVTPVLFLSIFISIYKKDINASWFLLALLAVEYLDEKTNNIALSWGEMYYAWGMAMNVLIIAVILFRKYIANYFAEGFVTSEVNFFKKAYQGYKFKLQEGGIIALCTLSFFLAFGAIFEGVIYKSYLIDSLPYREYIYRPLQFIFHILTALAALTLAIGSNPAKEASNESRE